MSIEVREVTADGSSRIGWDAEGWNYTYLQSDDGADSKVYSPIEDNYAALTVANTALTNETINSVTVVASFATIGDSGVYTRVGLRINETNYIMDTDFDIVLAYQLYSHAWNTNPSTGNNWTVSELDSLEPLIVKSTGGGARCSYVRVEVDYTANGGGGSDIESINGIFDSDIKKINGIDVADIASVNGINF